MTNMYMVSCRREFWSATDSSTTDEIRRLDLNGNGQAPPVAPATFLAAMAGKRVTVLVHGYNNEQRHAERCLPGQRGNDLEPAREEGNAARAGDVAEAEIAVHELFTAERRGAR